MNSRKKKQSRFIWEKGHFQIRLPADRHGMVKVVDLMNHVNKEISKRMIIPEEILHRGTKRKKNCNL